MGEELKRLCVDMSHLKEIILQNNNIDILLYLAKYNPMVTKKEIIERFGKGAEKGLDSLKSVMLVKDDEGHLSLTEEGIFQVDGLLSIIA